MSRTKKSKARARRRAGTDKQEKAVRCYFAHSPKWWRVMTLAEKLAATIGVIK